MTIWRFVRGNTAGVTLLGAFLIGAGAPVLTGQPAPVLAPTELVAATGQLGAVPRVAASGSSSTGPRANLTLSLSAPSTASVGGSISYGLTVGNGGPGTATGVIVTDLLPAGVSLVSSGGCGANGRTLTCRIGTL